MNPSTGRKTYCGVMEFMAPEDFICVPFWVMENLHLQETESVHVRLVTLAKGSFVKFKPHDMNFFKAFPNPKPMYVFISTLATGDML